MRLNQNAPFGPDFAKSAFPGTVIIRNDTAAPETLWELPAANFDKFLSGTGEKGYGWRSAIILLVPARAFPRDSGTLRTFAVSIRAGRRWAEQGADISVALEANSPCRKAVKQPLERQTSQQKPVG